MKKFKRQFSAMAAVAAALLVMLLSSAVYSQTVSVKMNSISDITDNKHALENLTASIQSDNPGVKRSAIYLAGKYRIAEAENPLLNQLKVEKDPNTRILIALVLYEMGSEKGLSVVKALSETDENTKVRRMAAQLYSQYLMNDTESASAF